MSKTFRISYWLRYFCGKKDAAEPGITPPLPVPIMPCDMESGASLGSRPPDSPGLETIVTEAGSYTPRDNVSLCKAVAIVMCAGLPPAVKPELPETDAVEDVGRMIVSAPLLPRLVILSSIDSSLDVDAWDAGKVAPPASPEPEVIVLTCALPLKNLAKGSPLGKMLKPSLLSDCLCATAPREPPLDGREVTEEKPPPPPAGSTDEAWLDIEVR